MKKFKLFFSCVIAGSILLSNSCGKNETENATIQKENPANADEASLLLDFISKTGDIINSDNFPFAITADEVSEEMTDIVVIDIRDSNAYIAGHIDGAILVDAKELPAFLENKVNLANYNKVVIACNSGQSSSYYVALLRMVGYANIYSLRFGMAGWSKKLSPNKIIDNLSNKFAGILETKIDVADKKYEFPAIKTGQTGGYGILISRVNSLFEEGYDKFRLKVDTLVQYADKYFIVNYWAEEDYSKGHLPGTYQFTPKQSLKKDKLLNSLPTDKPIAVYCSNGQQSAAVVAYLRVLGYDAFNVAFGTNGFMHSFMQSNLGKSFVPSENIADYPMVEGINPGLQTSPIEGNTIQSAEKETKAPPLKKKKKNSSGGGC
jgi:rhodanese-related sulfurtransferase